MNDKNALIIFCKNPLPGKVKTRLAKKIGDTRAAEIYRRLLLYTIQVARPMIHEVEIFIFFDPISGSAELRDLLGNDLHFVAQSGKDLGQRLSHAFEKMSERRKTVIVGSDCPALKTKHFQQAFSELNHRDVVLGPTEDGGYYLIGANKKHDVLFSNIPWSAPYVFSKTIKRLKTNRISYTCLEKLWDVDEYQDLYREVQMPNHSN